MIPKIIHSTGPSDKSTWNPIWNDCIGSWKNQFSELDYFHFNWNYEELDDLIRDDYPEFWDLYQLFSFYDMKIDFAQYCLLHKYGGIYHNLNVYCYQEFYESIKAALTDDGIIVTQAESLYYDREFIADLYKQTQELFPVVGYYNTLVPTYPSGSIGFVYGSKKYGPIDQLGKNPQKLEDMVYYTPEMHQASFTLPAFFKKLLV